MTIYKDTDPCTDIILDFIAEHESAGNYNAVIGNAKATRDLSRETLAGIYGVMDSLLIRGLPSTAVGRYQFVRATLQSLAEKAGIGRSDRFTPDLQDRLGWMLLCRRGYRDWWLSTIDDEQFAHNLSLEWASLPDPFNGGKSHYDGIGPNHAGTTLDAVYAMLVAARAAQP